LSRFDTPIEIASELARHIPQKLDRVLDPSAGGGALLLPIAETLRENNSKVYCVDSDPDAISDLRECLPDFLIQQTIVILDDFLQWSKSQKNPSFDCIIMNPPFAAKLDALTPIAFSVERGERKVRKLVPLEAAFVFRSLSLLKEGGRLLAVLPSSIVMGQSLHWLRDLMKDSGAIRSVHELPPRMFPKVESRMYLLVFDKGKEQRKLKLFNHDLKEPHQLDLWLTRSNRLPRWDYGFHKASNNLAVLQGQENLIWQPLSDLTKIYRGSVISPIKSDLVIHTTKYVEGYWQSRTISKQVSGDGDPRFVKKGDILVKRVGRNCSKSFGIYNGNSDQECSDCVYIIRPNPSVSSLSILFSLKALTSFLWAKPLLERGTGASYISRESLEGLSIPTKLNKFYPREYRRFGSANRRKGNLSKYINEVVSRLEEATSI